MGIMVNSKVNGIITNMSIYPNSSILYNKNGKNQNLFDKFQKLCIKYINVYAEYEINISSRARNKLAKLSKNRQLFNNLNNTQKTTLFDNTIYELVGLLKD